MKVKKIKAKTDIIFFTTYNWYIFPLTATYDL